MARICRNPSAEWTPSPTKGLGSDRTARSVSTERRTAPCTRSSGSRGRPEGRSERRRMRRTCRWMAPKMSGCCPRRGDTDRPLPTLCRCRRSGRGRALAVECELPVGNRGHRERRSLRSTCRRLPQGVRIPPRRIPPGSIVISPGVGVPSARSIRSRLGRAVPRLSVSSAVTPEFNVVFHMSTSSSLKSIR